jgi:hypothetical protein
LSLITRVLILKFLGDLIGIYKLHIYMGYLLDDTQSNLITPPKQFTTRMTPEYILIKNYICLIRSLDRISARILLLGPILLLTRL